MGTQSFYSIDVPVSGTQRYTDNTGRKRLPVVFVSIHMEMQPFFSAVISSFLSGSKTHEIYFIFYPFMEGLPSAEAALKALSPDDS